MKRASTASARSTPLRASAVSNSASRISSTRTAPAVPPAARPQRIGRPTSTAPGAERERLEDIGPAADPTVDEHLDTICGGLDDWTERVGGGEDRIQLAPAVIGDDDRRAPCSAASTASSGASTPLTITGIVLSAANASMSAQVNPGSVPEAISEGVGASCPVAASHRSAIGAATWPPRASGVRARARRRPGGRP